MKNGIELNGVELVEKAALASKPELNQEKIFHGELRSVSFEDEHFDTITLWDVLVMIENSQKELKEFYRKLKSAGIIGIKVRNVIFQKMAFHIQRPVRNIFQRCKIKTPTVFHPFCFTTLSINHLIKRLAFKKIEIKNSPLTSGDPYNHLPLYSSVWLAKKCIGYGSQFVSFITGGRCLFVPSILIWAKKP